MFFVFFFHVTQKQITEDTWLFHQIMFIILFLFIITFSNISIIFLAIYSHKQFL